MLVFDTQVVHFPAAPVVCYPPALDIQVLGEGLTRRIHLAVLSALVLSGIALQGAVWWYSIQAANRVWGTAGILVLAFAVGVWPRLQVCSWHPCGNV